MFSSRRSRIAMAAALVIVAAGAGGAVTYATTAASSSPTNDYSNGCSSPSHAFRLLNANGTCPACYSRINIASAPIPIAISTAGTAQVTKTVTVRNMTIGAKCEVNGFSELKFTNKSSNPDYDVRGNYFLDQGTTDFHYISNQSETSSTGPGAGYVSYTQTTAGSSDLFLNHGEVNADLIVVQAHHTFTIKLYLQQDANSCFVEAQNQQSS